jgi:leucyl aminopeptidase
MSTLFEQIQKTRPPKVSQVTGSADSKALAGIDQLLVVLPARVPAAAWNRLPQGKKVRALMRRRKPGSVPAVTTRLGNKRQTAVFVGNVDASKDAFETLTFARRMVTAATSEKAGVLGILVVGFEESQREKLASQLVSAALAAAYVMPTFKSRPSPAKIRSVRLLGFRERLDLDRELAEAEGNNVARFLTALPANKLDAAGYTSLLKEMATAEGWQFKKYGVKELQTMGAGAFLAVAQGNADDSAAIGVAAQSSPALCSR